MRDWRLTRGLDRPQISTSKLYGCGPSMPQGYMALMRAILTEVTYLERHMSLSWHQQITRKFFVLDVEGLLCGTHARYQPDASSSSCTSMCTYVLVFKWQDT